MEKLSIASEADPSLALLRQPQVVIPNATGSYGKDESGAIPYRQFFRRWKWVLILSSPFGIGVGYLVTLFQPTLYGTRTSLEILNLNDGFLNVKQFLPVNNSDGPSITYGDIQTQIKLLQSDSVVQSVIVGVLSPYESQKTGPPASSRLKMALGLAPTRSEYVQAEAKRLSENLKIRAVGQTRIIEVTGSSTNAHLAADFLNKLCVRYIDLNSKARYDMGVRTSQSLSKLLEAERQKVRLSEDALQSYARTTGLMFTSLNKGVAEEKLSALQAELAKAEEARIQAEVRFDNVKGATPDGLPEDPNRGSLGEYKTRLAELHRQLAELSATYTPDYFKIKRLEAQIAALNSSIKREEHDVVQRAEGQYKEALGQEKLLAASYANQSKIVSDLAQRSVQYNILEQEVEANRKGYDELLRNVKDASVAATIQTDTARVVDSAFLPQHPESPVPLLNCAVGFLGFLILGFAWAFVRDRSDVSLREPGEGVQYLGLKELGAVVHVRRSSFRSLGRLGPRSGYAYSHVMESYRAVVTSLLMDASVSHRLLLVTSPGPSEGKTTVTANVGVMLATLGRRVLLVDGDMRKCDLHNSFAIGNERGLSTLLMTDQIEDQSLDNYVQKTCIPGLSLLTSGPPSLESVHLLYSAKLPKLIAFLKKDYEYVLVDTPPALTFADARVMGPLADGVVLVARSGLTSREAASAVQQRLAADGTKVVGLILNDWDPSSSTRTYYAKYSASYR